MLFKIGPEGQFNQIKKIPHLENYEFWKSRLQPGQFEKIWALLESELDEDFSVGTKYPDGCPGWDAELSYLWEATNHDSQQAGYFLGIMMMDVVIHSKEKWCCTKTNITHRDFETNYYFKPKK